KFSEILPGSPAEEAGFQPDDEVIQVEDNSVSTWEEFTTIVRDNPEEELSMLVQRNGEKIPLTVVPDSLPQMDMDGEEVMIGQIGVHHAYEKSFFGTFEWGFTQTYETTKMI